MLTFLYEYGEIETKFTVIDTSEPAPEKNRDNTENSAVDASQMNIDNGLRSPKTGESRNRFLMLSERLRAISQVQTALSGQRDQKHGPEAGDLRQMPGCLVPSL